MIENSDADGMLCMDCGALFPYDGAGEIDEDVAYTSRRRNLRNPNSFYVRLHTHPEDVPPAPARRYRPRG